MKTKACSRAAAWFLSAATLISASALSFTVSVSAAGKVADTSPKTSKTLYNGVSYDYYELPSSSKYGAKDFSVVEFDLAQSDLYLDVVSAGSYSNQLAPTSKILSNFNKNNTEGKTAIAAINGDLWMVNYCHSRTSNITYGGVQYGPVVKKSLSYGVSSGIHAEEIISPSLTLNPRGSVSVFFTTGPY